MFLICKYDFIYLFSNLFRLISLNGPSGRKKAQEGEKSLGDSVGAKVAGLDGPRGPPGGRRTKASRTRHVGIVPH